MKPTPQTYKTLQSCYDHLNRTLFKGKLPDCLITLSAELKKARGYYRHHPFKNKESYLDEIALNPFTFMDRTDVEIFSTLCHEMVHLWQFHEGDPPNKPYHNREWADKMEELGLMPTDTGLPDGKRTGKRVTHYIIPKGPYQKAIATFEGKIEWRGMLMEKPAGKNKRVKYRCDTCEVNAYGKPGLSLICGQCEEEMV